MIEPFIISGFLIAICVVLALALRKALGPDHLLQGVWAAFAISILSFAVYGMSDGRLAGFDWIFATLGSATCGVTWLLSRTLFRTSEKFESWPFIVVGLLFVTGVMTDFLVAMGAPDAATGFILNIHALISSAVLVLALIEPLIGYSKSARRLEKSFRVSFAVGYACLLGIGYVWLRSEGSVELAQSWGPEIRLGCALFALCAGGTAVWFRTRHPYLAKFKTKADADDEKRLAELIRNLLLADDRFTQADLKVADLARLSGSAEHKISRAITSGLGFENFNRLVNHYRIDRARLMLRDPASQRLPVLTIAMDCGFGSIGPFNRAFKEATGMTPTAWRRAGS